MTPDKLNAALINAIRKKISQETNVANLLMDILSIGKEAIYRRFRGEMPFSLMEAMLISQKLGISLDQLNGVTLDGERVLDLNLFQEDNPEKAYFSIADYYLTFLKNITFYPESTIWDTSNRISHLFILSSPALNRFSFFKWLYQYKTINTKRVIAKYEDIYIPSDLKIKEKEIIKILMSFQRNYYLWDNMIFKSVISDIQFFKELKLISPESLKDIKLELLLLIDKLEELAVNGFYSNGNEVQIYISPINFGTSYSYIESGEQYLSFIKVYDLHTITSHNEIVFENMKVWAQSMKRFSVLISQSGDMFRYKFFQQQRDYVNRL